jgi:hypothetical protein
VATLGEQVLDDAEMAVLLEGCQLDGPFQEATGFVEVLAGAGGALSMPAPRRRALSSVQMCAGESGDPLRQ